MKLNDFDYYLPPELIAQSQIYPRDHSRLLVLKKETGEITHHNFFNLLEIIPDNSVLVFNNTKVIPARLHAKKKNLEKIIEILLLKKLEDSDFYSCLAKPGKRLKIGDEIEFISPQTNKDNKFTGKIIRKNPDATIELMLNIPEDKLHDYLEVYGELPLPPYIHKKMVDRTNYQTCYAENAGSIAAPTAGLHFTPDLLLKLKNKNIVFEFIELQVGLGTFLPVKVDEITEHKMHAEKVIISENTADRLNNFKKAGVNIFVVGTTTCRALESATDEQGLVQPYNQETNIFIYPGYKFKFVENLITNFHLPKSTLLMLVSALAGKTNIINAYNQAIAQKYRFYSFGDAMLIY